MTELGAHVGDDDGLAPMAASEHISEPIDFGTFVPNPQRKAPWLVHAEPGQSDD